MRRGIIIAWAVLGLVIVAMVVAWGRTHDSSSLNPPMLTQQLEPVKLRGPAPEFSGTTLTGATISNASLAGKPAVIDFAAKHGWRFPIIWDPGDKLPSRFHVAGKPSLVIIDRDGRLVVLVPGPHMLSEYRAAIDKVLAE